MVKYRGGRKKYDFDLDIAVYFVFPEYGVAVALRPGDQLIFNSRHYHCVSMREQVYKESEVYVTTFYMKTAVVGQNDNRIELTNMQKEVLERNKTK